MARKIEDFTDRSMPNPRVFGAVLVGKRDREVAILAGAFLDSLLADLISLRLRDDRKEVEDFVGLDADGRAPVGSFGARIQLAYLLSLIDKSTMQSLRLIKDVRNLFSHHVSVGFGDERVVAKIRKLVQIFGDDPPRRLRKNRQYQSKEEFAARVQNAGFTFDACAGLFAGAATVEIKLLLDACRRRKAIRRRKRAG